VLEYYLGGAGGTETPQRQHGHWILDLAFQLALLGQNILGNKLPSALASPLLPLSTYLYTFNIQIRQLKS
jgi:hypothetical protein